MTALSSGASVVYFIFISILTLILILIVIQIYVFIIVIVFVFVFLYSNNLEVYILCIICNFNNFCILSISTIFFSDNVTVLSVF